MNSHHISLVNLVLLCLSFLAALLLFQYGFLLKRREILSRSECSDVTYTRAACWIPAQYKRAIIIVIDALRYDFAAPPSYSPLSGHLPIINELLSSRNESAALMHFIADPPTTTMQRLKGLTTGSLPTFIDVASNFASTEILEDNWVDQIHRSGRNMTFLGDDTWASLYPTKFHRSYHVPSFDINDLHGVDNVVLEHIYEELQRPDWSVLIAHFLGVDHCGHKYGPDHPEMVKKLAQMNEMIRQVINVMDHETVLVIFGDHGMTETGDHGGDAQLELDAALFVYSHKKLVFAPPPDSVSQVDLVPTLSLLLDSPIPFSNIGVVIDCLIPPELRSAALSSNVWQIDRYAHLMSSEVPDLYLALREFEAKEESDERSLKLMRKLQNLFRTSWTHFSIPFMRTGVESVIEAMFGVFDAYCRAGEVLPGWIIFRSALFFMQTSAYLEGNESSSVLAFLETVLVTALIFHFISLINRLLSSSFPTRYLFALCLVLAHAGSYLSNSYIVFESTSARFLAQTALVIAVFSNFTSSKVHARKRKYGLVAIFERFLSIQQFLVLVVLLAMFRVGRLFEKCREEQQEACVATFLSQPLGKLQEGNEKIIRFLVGVIALISSGFITQRILRDFSSYLSLFVLPTVAAIVAFWAMQLLPEKAAERFSNFTLVSAQIVYFLAFLNVLIICIVTFNRSVRLLYGCSISFMVSLSLYLCLLLGDSLSISYIVFIVILICATDIIYDELMLLAFFSLLTSHGFFAISHHATFSSIPWQAGFVGVQGNFFIQAVPATFIISHIFSSHIIVVAALPYSVAKSAESGFFGSLNGLLRRSYLFLFLSAAQVLCACLAGFFHRRHLMVWKIFAPKFVFESVGFIVVCIIIIMVNCIFRSLNVINAVKR